MKGELVDDSIEANQSRRRENGRCLGQDDAASGREITPVKARQFEGQGIERGKQVSSPRFETRKTALRRDVMQQLNLWNGGLHHRAYSSGARSRRGALEDRGENGHDLVCRVAARKVAGYPFDERIERRLKGGDGLGARAGLLQLRWCLLQHHFGATLVGLRLYGYDEAQRLLPDAFAGDEQQPVARLQVR